jgi:phosphoesterase RecJ-like protein
MDATMSALLACVLESRSVLLTGPEGPDGDSIGACLALRRILAVAAPGVRVDVAGAPGRRYAWMADSGVMIADPHVAVDYDGVVVLDGDCTRLVKEVDASFRAARWTGIIDHHRSTDTAPYTVAYFDPNSESTCSMIAALADAWGVPLDADMAEQLYTGLVFDTGGFRHSNTRPATHALAAQLLGLGIDSTRITHRVLHERRKEATLLLGHLVAGTQFLHDGALALAACPESLMTQLGAEAADFEGIVELLQSTTGVAVSAVLQQRGPARTKVSLRSGGRVDVAALAKILDAGGGGHAKAAGVTVPCGLDEAVARVERAVAGLLGGA